MNLNTDTIQTGEATYCPEDDKLRLYIGRVPREEYEALRAEGWTSTPKQECDFVAVWSIDREETALAYGGGIIGDEDQSPADRAADRAERFGGYADKREGEALDKADHLGDTGGAVGHQSRALAERRAASMVRRAGGAVRLWDKAEYWTRRTDGVIAHALHKSAPGVRMGRIKVLEAELRKLKESNEQFRREYAAWKKLLEYTGEDAHRRAVGLSGLCHVWSFKHPRPASVGEHTREHGASMYTLLTQENDPITAREAAELFLARYKEPATESRGEKHLELRIAYENQMLQAAGGGAAWVEMEAGGWIGEHQIQKVNKSPATGRVVSVQIWGQHTGYTKESGYTVQETRPRLMTLCIERMKSAIYRPPTDEERQAFQDAKKAAKKEKVSVPWAFPSREDAERLQAQWNAEAASQDQGKHYPRKAGEVCEITQAKFTAWNGTDRGAGVREYRGMRFRVRSCLSWCDGVIVLTDKPTKPLLEGVLGEVQPCTA